MKKLLQLSLLLVGVSSFAQLDCASATEITSTGVVSCPQITGTYPTGSSTCVGAPNNPSPKAIWFTYTATANGELTITSDLPQNDGVTNSNDTRISVFTGTCAALVCYNANDDINPANTGGNYLSNLTFPVASGTTYYIVWDSGWSDKPFDFEVTLNTISCMKTYYSIPGEVSTTTASLYWSKAIGDPANYNVDWSTDLTAAAGAGTLVSVPAGALTYGQADLTGLTAESTFRYFVQSDCGLTQSDWSGPYYGFLAKTLPYSNGFESPAYEDGFVGSGWTFAEQAPLAQGGSVFSYTSSSTAAAKNSTLISRAISLKANEQVTLTFYTRLYAEDANGNEINPVGTHSVKVWVNNTPLLTNATQLGANITVSGKTYVLQTRTFTATAAGIYYFIFNDVTPKATAVTLMFLDTVNFTSVLGVNDYLTSKFSVYPNPVKNTINFSNGINALVSTIDITDLNGRVVKTMNINATEGQISINELSTGIYMMRITTDQGMAVKKIVKE